MTAKSSDAGDGRTTVYDLVVRAWAETLPDQAFDPDLTWGEAGADSLRGLHLAMRLEEALGRPVPLDLLSEAMTARTLAAGLAGEAASAVHPEVRARVFLLPGIYGDAPGLARLRANFADAVRLDVVDLPGLDHPASLLSDRDATCAILTTAILSQAAPKERISLMGWSYGGFAAVEVAHRLEAAGRVVEFVGLLDAMVGAPPHRPEPDDEAEAASAPRTRSPRPRRKIVPQRLRPWPSETARNWAGRLAFGLFVRLRLAEAARRAHLFSRATPEEAYRRHKLLLVMTRGRSIVGWSPPPLDAPALLVATADGRAAASPEFWTARLPRLRTIHIACTHRQLLRPATVALYKEDVLKAIDEARSGGWGYADPEGAERAIGHVVAAG